MASIRIFLIFALSSALFSCADATSSARRTITLPLKKRTAPQSLRKRQKVTAVGLGDFADIAYSVEVQIGKDTVPVVFDSGSSDLWSISSACSTSSCGTNPAVPRISQSSLTSTGLDLELQYGDSTHGTSADGLIVTGTAGLGGMTVDTQYLGAVNLTTTGLTDQGLSGIFGVGFPNPLSSVVFGNVLVSMLPPDFQPADAVKAFLQLLPTKGPLLARLMLDGQLEQPMYTVTMERETIDVGGNIGQVTLGGLPQGVSNSSLTWVPVRLYTEAEGGLPGPTPYPLAWEVPIDAAFLNGVKLPQPILPNGVSYTVLMDTGTSFLAGPQDVVGAIYSALGGTSDASSNPPSFPCNQPVQLSFQIGGKMFPIDPRDFLSGTNFPDQCSAGLVLPTDPPAPSALQSWILGSVFLRSNLLAFYFGNLTNPAADPPRIGILSTVPSNADALLASAVAAASATGFPQESIVAPTGAFTATATDSEGVAQQPTQGSSKSSQPGKSGGHNNALKSSVPSIRILCVMFAILSIAI